MTVLRVDAVNVTVSSGATVLDACTAAGIDTPTVCAAEAGGTRGVCRVCVVEITGNPTLLPACAAFAAGESRFTGIGHLRVKESDRIQALAEILREAGVEARAEPDALTVRGGARAGDPLVRRLRTRNDHRIAMSAGLLALGLPGLLIENPGCVAKSYPAFWRALDSLAVRR